MAKQMEELYDNCTLSVAEQQSNAYLNLGS